jgi:hypothetical protein
MYIIFQRSPEGLQQGQCDTSEGAGSGFSDNMLLVPLVLLVLSSLDALASVAMRVSLVESVCMRARAVKGRFEGDAFVPYSSMASGSCWSRVPPSF